MGKVRGGWEEIYEERSNGCQLEGTKPFEGVKIKMTKAMFYNRAHGG